MNQPKVQLSSFLSRRVIKETNVIESNCCEAIQRKGNKQPQKQQIFQDGSKKISCSLLRSRKQLKDTKRSKVDSQKTIIKQQQSKIKQQTIFVNNFLVPPPVKTYHHHHHHHHFIVQPTQTFPTEHNNTHFLQQTDNKQRFYSSRSTFPSTKLSSTQNLKLPSSFLTPSTSTVLSPLIQSSHPFQQFKVRCSESKQLDSTKKPLRLQQSEVMSKFFSPRGSIVLQASKESEQ